MAITRQKNLIHYMLCLNNAGIVKSLIINNNRFHHIFVILYAYKDNLSYVSGIPLMVLRLLLSEFLSAPTSVSCPLF